ncbi:acyltransferase [Hyphomonas sp. BRH_c22]|uniref:acyltransferase family protein n=1 Tax=Hyphomonas sp. BRH_c22 TaxID=1629710 RepID=UPI000A8279A2|nr:acyltransferase [Hyphomonas sp. BRH_c22]
MLLNHLQPSKVFQRSINPANYRPEIDGLRFFAIMNVMIGHLLERVERFWIAPNPQLDNGPINAVLHFFASPNQGVLLFFAISGFIIAKQMQDVAAGRFDSAFVTKYYVRRITRIFPPYYFIIFSTFCVYFFLGLQPSGLNRSAISDVSLPHSLLASVFYVHGAVFDSLPRLYALGWSLEVEVQFYVLAPLIFLTLFRGDDRAAPWRFAAMLAVFFAVSFVAINKIVPVNSFTILSYIVYFGVGIMLARHEGAFRRAFALIGSRASLVLGTATVLGMFWLGTAHFEPLAMTLFSWAFSLGIIVILFGLAFQPDTLFGRFCRLPYITYIGLACYSLYLVHLQLFHIAAQIFARFVPINYFTLFGGFALIMLAGLIAGYAFFVLVEKPFASWRPSSLKARKTT